MGGGGQQSPVSLLMSSIFCLLSHFFYLLFPFSCLRSSLPLLLSSIFCLPSPVFYLLSPFSCLLSPVSQSHLSTKSTVSCTTVLSPLSCLPSPVSRPVSCPVSCFLSLVPPVLWIRIRMDPELLPGSGTRKI